MKDRKATIETRSLGEQVYDHLCDMIINGNIDYGQTLNIKQLAEELNVSPMPVREALKRLEVEGLVVIKPRSMCILREPTARSVLNAIAMREILEIYCVENIYRTVDPQKLEILREKTDAMRAMLSSAPFNMKGYIKNDGLFHTEMCALAANDFIDKSYREVSLHLNMNHLYNMTIMPDTAQTFRDHTQLVDALAEHSSQAVDIIKRHLEQSRKNVLSGKMFAARD